VWITGATTGNVYGIITASSYSAPNTTITISADGSLQNESLTGYVASLTPTNPSYNSIHSVASVRDFGATGDGVTDDTAALRAAFTSGKSIIGVPGDIYLTDYITVDTISNVVFNGNGATLKRLDTSPTSWYKQGALMALVACNNIEVHNWIFDGDRANLIATTPGNVGMNNGITVYGNNTAGSAVLNDNGGETKGSKNISIHHNSFYRTGANAAGIDKFGDGILIFAVDGITIKDNYFEDMGRWAVAAGDVFNLTINDNIISNTTTGTLATALGSIDIENESSDTTNGSYSRNIQINNNKMTGRVSMSIGTADSTANSAGTTHYTKNVHVENNKMFCNQYTTYGVWGINCLASKKDTKSPTLKDIWILNNKITGESGTRLDLGIAIQGNVTTVLLENFWVESNIVIGFTNGVSIKSTQSPTLSNFHVCKNYIASEHNANGTGLQMTADVFDGVIVNENIVRDYILYGINLQKNTGTTSFIILNNNMVYDGAATFTGTGIRAVGDTVTSNNNFVSQTGGRDYDISAGEVISNSAIGLKYKTTELVAISGATASFASAIPAGSLVVGVSTRVTKAITGATSFGIGDGTDATRWGTTRPITLGSTSDLAQITISSPIYYTSATDIVLTANGGNFTDGDVRIVLHYFEITPPAG